MQPNFTIADLENYFSKLLKNLVDFLIFEFYEKLWKLKNIHIDTLLVYY